MSMLFCLDPSEMLTGSLQTTFSVADTRRTSPSIIVSMQPFLDEFVGDEGINTYIIIHSNDPQSLGRHGGDYLCLFWQRRYQQRLPCFCVGESGHNFLSTRRTRFECWALRASKKHWPLRTPIYRNFRYQYHKSPSNTHIIVILCSLLHHFSTATNLRAMLPPKRDL